MYRHITGGKLAWDKLRVGQATGGWVGWVGRRGQDHGCTISPVHVVTDATYIYEYWGCTEPPITQVGTRVDESMELEGRDSFAGACCSKVCSAVIISCTS